MFSHLSQILTFRLILNEIVISLKAPFSPSPANGLKYFSQVGSFVLFFNYALIH